MADPKHRPGPLSGYREEPDPRGKPGGDQQTDGKQLPEEADPDEPKSQEPKPQEPKPQRHHSGDGGSHGVLAAGVSWAVWATANEARPDCLHPHF